MSLFTNAQRFIAGGVNSPVRAFAGVGGEAMELAFGADRVQAAVIPRGRGARPHAAHRGFVVEFSSVRVPPQAAPIAEIIAGDHFALGPLFESEEASAGDGH